MRILHTVEFYHPNKGGAQEVVRQISERLAARGHHVTVATTYLPERRDRVLNSVVIADFRISGNAVYGFSGATNEYQQFLRQGQFDIMMNYAAQQWTADLAFPLLDSLPYRKVLAPCGFSGLGKPDFAFYFEELPTILRRYDRLIFHSDTYQDIAFARRHGLDNTAVIPNGAAAEEFDRVSIDFRRRYGIPRDLPLLLTVGNHNHRDMKGHAATIAAFRKARIGPAVLVIIGGGAHGKSCFGACRRRASLARWLSFGERRVILLDPPREEVVAAYQAADLFVFASKVECSPVVLFEALAAGLPFVTVPAGNAEEIVQWSGGGIIVPSPTDRYGFVRADTSKLARAIETIMADKPRRRALAAAGRQAWRDRFRWDVIAERYESLYRSVLELKHTTGGYGLAVS